MLPNHIVDIIMQAKYKLETCSFSSFVDDFTIYVMSKKLLQTMKSHFVRYQYKLRVKYKPTNKSLFMNYDTIYSSRNIGQKLCKQKVIASLANDAVNLEYTVQHKDEMLKCGLMSYQYLTQYKNDVFKLRKVMGTQERFERLLECYFRTP